MSWPTLSRKETPTALRKYAAWLEPEEILCVVEARDRHAAIDLAAGAIADRHSLDAGPVARALWRRELVGSTALGHGVAIPHARIEGIDRPLTLFLRPRRPIDFAAPDGLPVTNVLVMLVPADGDTDDHLQFLALVSQMFSDADFRARLDGATTAERLRSAFGDYIRRSA